MEISFSLNGAAQRASVRADRRLIDLIRVDLALTGTKEGCAVGVCGLCSVIVNGKLVSACLMLAVQIDDAEVRTIEGLAGSDGQLNGLQRAFIEEGGFQCGICTSGQLMAATALLEETPRPSEADIRRWMMGNLCRCTGYLGIIRAIESAARSERP